MNNLHIQHVQRKVVIEYLKNFFNAYLLGYYNYEKDYIEDSKTDNTTCLFYDLNLTASSEPSYENPTEFTCTILKKIVKFFFVTYICLIIVFSGN